VTLGRQLRRPDLPTTGARWCEAALPEGSLYRFLARERTRLFPPELFADLFQTTGRRSVPPSILAVVMVLQSAGGPVGSGGGRPVRLRRALALCGRGGRCRGWGGDGQLRAHGAGRLPRPAASLG
jgi:hypothetical protein